MCSSCSLAMPHPVSRTETVIVEEEQVASRRMEPSSAMASRAFRRRLRKTSLSFTRSPLKAGSAGSRRDVNSTGLSAQEAAKERTTCSINERKENSVKNKDRLWFREDRSVRSCCIYSTSSRMDSQYRSETISG